MQFDKDHLNQLYRYALSLERNSDRAYDLLQSGLERFLRGETQQLDNPMAYIKRIIRNLAIDQWRQSDNRLFQDRQDLQQNSVVLLHSDSLDGQCLYEDELAELLEQLSLQERELLYLWAVEGYTVDEIALWQEVPKGTLLSRIHRLRARLKADNPNLAASLRGGVC